MNKLSLAKRVQILSMLVENSSMRPISRVAEVSINTVSALLVDAGKACATHHDETVRGVRAKRIQADEIWSFCYAKAKNVPTAKAAPEDAGDVDRPGRRQQANRVLPLGRAGCRLRQRVHAGRSRPAGEPGAAHH